MKKTLCLFIVGLYVVILAAPVAFCADTNTNWALAGYGGSWSASRYYSSTTTAYYAFDDDLNTWWSSGYWDAATIFRTLPEPKHITRVDLAFRGIYTQWRSWEVYYQDASGTWVLVNKGRVENAPGLVYEVSFYCDVTAQAWKAIVDQERDWSALAEFRLWGSGLGLWITVTPLADGVLITVNNGTPPFTILRNGIELGTTETNSYIDSNYPPGSQTTYEVRDASGLRGMQSVLTCPAAPTVTATSDVSTVSLLWNSVSTATAYRCYRNGTFLTETTECSYTDRYLAPDTEFTYEVRAVNASGEGRPGTVTAWTLPQPPPPDRPQNLRLIERTPTSLTIAWDAVVGASGYKVYLDGVLHGTTTQTTYVFDSLTSGRQYAVQVQAYSSQGDGEVSSTLYASTLGIPQAVTGITAQIEADRVILTWNPPAGGEPATGYNVYRNGSLLTTVTITTVTDDSVVPNSEYTYEVAAINDAGEGPRSAITVTTADIPLPGPPANVTPQSTVRSVFVSWDPANYALDYVLRVNDVVYATTAATHYRITGLTPDTELRISVSARNKAGESPPATVQTRTLPGAVSLYAAAYGSGFVARWVPSSPELYDQPDGYRIYVDGELLTELGETQYGKEMNWPANTEHCIKVDALYSGMAISSYAIIYSAAGTTPEVSDVIRGLTTTIRGLWPLLGLVTAVAISFGVWDRLRRWGL